jgi:hypothetical protein
MLVVDAEQAGSSPAGVCAAADVATVATTRRESAKRARFSRRIIDWYPFQRRRAGNVDRTAGL